MLTVQEGLERQMGRIKLVPAEERSDVVTPCFFLMYSISAWSDILGFYLFTLVHDQTRL